MRSSVLTASSRSLALISIAVVLAALALVGANRWRATAASANHTISTSSPDGPSLTPAATITVNSLSDVANGTDGLCTLREAISAANDDVASGAMAGECIAGSSSGSDTIDLTGVTGTIDLTSALPIIFTNMSINGPGSAQLTVRRSTGGFYRIFYISAATSSISGLTVRDGRAADTNL